METMQIEQSDRGRHLRDLADRIYEHRDELVSALIRDTGATYRSAMERDITLAQRLYEGYAKETTAHAAASPRGATVSVSLPYNAVGLACSMSVGAAYLAGNTVRVRFPSRVATFTSRMRPLIEGSLPGVTVTELDGTAFMTRSFADPATRAVVAFGDDKWMPAYKERARARNVKVVFEGPGSDPFLVLPGADVAAAARGAVRAGYQNSGQSCSAAKRFYVHDSVWPEFVERVLEIVRALRAGDPHDEATDIGPIGSPFVVRRIQQQLDDAIAKGARVAIGGYFLELPDVRHPVLSPTVLLDCHQQMAIMRQETFAPVIPIVKVESDEQALEFANDSDYGLTATVFAGAQAEALGRTLRLTHGNVFVNSTIGDPANADARKFWGGYKNSAWIWDWEGRYFVHKEGPRSLIHELSHLAPATPGGVEP